jgi:hypothetical protein
MPSPNTTNAVLRIRDVHESLRELLEKEHAKRDARTSAGQDWNRLELEAMTHQVNLIRGRLGKPGITVDDIVRAEQGAVGHVDYASKFALYCAELAVLGTPGSP